VPGASILLICTTAGAAVGGIMVGFAVGRSRVPKGDAVDWRIRMAARDRELADSAGRLADAAVEIQTLRARMDSSVPDPATEARIATLTEELGLADEELTRLRSLGVDRTQAGSSDMARRLEALEVELSTLASMRCPDPAAHRRARPTRVRLNRPDESGPPGDDLTRITGVGPGLAEILNTMGYRTFGDIAALTDEDLEEIGRVTGGIAGPSAREGWVESARRLGGDAPHRVA
jgi:predicted flap endonuclease-1-like 5' DNA nuclease